MNESAKSVLPTMDESLFCRLLEGHGRVQVNIVMLAQYYVPFVSFLADNEAPPVLYGAIVRGKDDLLAAQTVTDLLGLLRDIAGESTRLEIHPPEHLNGTVGNSTVIPLLQVSHWLL